MNFFPKNFGGERTDPETVKRDGWRGYGTLVVNASDPRLNWTERELIKQIGERLYGDKPKQEKSYVVR